MSHHCNSKKKRATLHNDIAMNYTLANHVPALVIPVSFCFSSSIIAFVGCESVKENASLSAGFNSFGLDSSGSGRAGPGGDGPGRAGPGGDGPDRAGHGGDGPGRAGPGGDGPGRAGLGGDGPCSACRGSAGPGSAVEKH